MTSIDTASRVVARLSSSFDKLRSACERNVGPCCGLADWTADCAAKLIAQ
jgi:hypothetical protein